MTKSIENIKGIIPAIFTPFSENNKPNLKILHKYLAYLIDAGSDGFFVSGANGECFLQSNEERSQFTEAVVKELDGAKPVIFHIGAINPQDACFLAAKAKKLKVAAISSVIPFYYGYSIREIADYYKKLIQLSERPLIVYYAPDNSGVKISNNEFIDNIVNLPGVKGIKYTYSDIYQLQILANGKKGQSLKTYGGFDQMGISFLSMGSNGLIGATFNLIPEVYVKMYACFRAGNIKKAMQYQQIANKFSVQIKKHTKSSYKAFIGLRGINVGKPRACWTDVSAKDIAELEKILENVLQEIKSAE
jgi:N-acetylneuraminate lyase